MARKNSDNAASAAKLKSACDAAFRNFAHRPDVTGIDVGYRWTGGKPTGEKVIRVHVREKLPVSALEKADIFPKDIEGVPLDVIQGHYKIQSATIPAQHQRRFPILLGGISIAHKNVTAGTIGAVVIDEENEVPALLSNWHVLAGPTGKIGDAVVQPGPRDGGAVSTDKVGELSRWILDHDGDAAIAALNGERDWMPFSYGSFQALGGARDPRLGEKLKKSGRSTALTEARVDGEGTYFINYQTTPNVVQRVGVRGFKLVSISAGNPSNQELSSGGDSGAVWYAPGNGNAVGLHFAGETDPNPMAEHAIACNMTRVLDRLNIRLATPEDLIELRLGATASDLQALPVNSTGFDGYSSAAPERLVATQSSARRTISRSRYIWPRLEEALVQYQPEIFRGVTLREKITERIGNRTAALGAIRTAIVDSDDFRRDAIVPRFRHLRRARRYIHVVGVLANFYELQGHTVVN